MLKRKLKTGYLYILPIVVLIVFFWYITIGYSFILSLNNYNGMAEPIFVGLENYKKLFSDKTFLNSLGVAFKFVIITAPIQTILAFFLAAWVSRKRKTKSAKFVRNAMIIPTLASTSVLGIVIRIMLNNDKSPLNPILKAFGVESTFLLGSESAALITLIIINILIHLGYFMTLYMASITDIPEGYFDAALIDGASTWKTYTKITFPLVKNTTILLMFLSAIDSFKIFDIVYTMTGGGPGRDSTLTPVVYSYLYGFKYSKFGYSMAIGTVLIFIIVFLLLSSKKLLSKKGKMY